MEEANVQKFGGMRSLRDCIAAAPNNPLRRSLQDALQTSSFRLRYSYNENEDGKIASAIGCDSIPDGAIGNMAVIEEAPPTIDLPCDEQKGSEESDDDSEIEVDIITIDEPTPLAAVDEVMLPKDSAEQEPSQNIPLQSQEHKVAETNDSRIPLDDNEFDDRHDVYAIDERLHRLWPSLATFYRLVTRWQPCKSAVPGASIPEPAISGDFTPSNVVSEIPVRFESCEDHRKSFAPLLLKECLAGLQSREERDRTMREKYMCGWRRGSLISNLLWKDSKRSRNIPNAAGALYILTVGLEDRLDSEAHHEFAEFVPGDLVMLSCSGWGADVKALGVVQAWDPEMDMLHLNTDSISCERVCVCVCVHANQAREAAQGGWLTWSQISSANIPNTSLWLVCIGSILTAAREFQALLSLRYIEPELRDNMLTGQIRGATGRRATSEYLEPPKAVPPELWQHLCRTFDKSQIKAIWEVANSDANDIRLLQGPPGTGKTKTILGILSVFLAGGIPPAHGSNSSSKAAGKSIKITVGATLAGGNRPRGNSLVDTIDTTTARLLVCAPSNTAVDEIVFRLKTEGLIGEDGQSWFPKVVRIGVPGGRFKQNNSGRFANTSNAGPIRSSSLKQVEEVVQETWLDAIVEAKRKVSRANVAQIRKQVLSAAHIVCATLSGSGSQGLLEVLMQASVGTTNRSVQGNATAHEDIFTGFDAVVIDEAAQAVEPSALIPFKFNPRVVVLVGDPAQLPATILSHEVERAGYGRSLFSRLQLAEHPVLRLDMQYRMHPAICDFASRAFYDGELHTAPALLQKSRPQPFHQFTAFQPFAFHNLVYGRQSRKGNSSSYANIAEINYVLQMYKFIREKYHGDKLNVGIIAPYNLHIAWMRASFSKMYPGGLSRSSTHGRVEISTVDGFQGREMDIIIFSCVRAPDVPSAEPTTLGNSIGFLSDPRRLNVAITRAKHALWIVGHAPTLMQDAMWRRLVQDAERRDVLLTIEDADGFSSLCEERLATAASTSSMVSAAPENPTRHRRDEIKRKTGRYHPRKPQKRSRRFDSR